MEAVVLNELPVRLEFSTVLKVFKMDEEHPFIDELRDIYDTALKTAQPKAVVKHCEVEVLGETEVRVEDVKFDSKLMAHNFKGVSECYAYVVTCGIEVNDWSMCLDDSLHIWWADKIKEMILGDVNRVVRGRIKELLRAEKLGSMNPGSLPDWPITEQEALFSLIGDVKEKIGVTLTESMLMLPTKSVSGFLFAVNHDYENCMFCEREHCPNRRLPFDRTMRDIVLGAEEE